jgi:hypothetical protein
VNNATFSVTTIGGISSFGAPLNATVARLTFGIVSFRRTC